MTVARIVISAAVAVAAWGGPALPGLAPALPMGHCLANKPEAHPLNGRHWSSKRGLVKHAVLIDAVRAADLALLGEVHDNGHHHAFRGSLLRDVRGFGEPYTKSATLPSRVPAVVLEHIRADQRPALDLFAGMVRSGQHLDRPAEFFRFLKWDQSGWPDKKLFEPMINSLLSGRHLIVAGDPPRDTVRAVAKQGLTALPAGEAERLSLAEGLDARLKDALLAELEASHCGLMPKSAFGNLAEAQRYRDAHLAAALIEAANRQGSAVLFAGNGHIRSDRGVPYYLRRMAPGKKIVTIQLAETEPGKTDPSAYVLRDPDGRPAADFVVFTARPVRKDPCIEMRERFGTKK